MRALTRPTTGPDQPTANDRSVSVPRRERDDRELITEILLSGGPTSGVFPRRTIGGESPSPVAAEGEGVAEDCYRTLVRRYWKAVFVLLRSRVSSARDAEDLAQEAFLRAFRSLPKLDDPKLFLGWLLRITRNLATDHLRRRRPEVSLDQLETGSPTTTRRFRSDGESVEETVELQDEVARVMADVDRLPDIYREVVTLRYVQGLSNRELAERLGEPEGTIRNRLFRALAKLRDALGTNPEKHVRKQRP